MQDNHSIYKRFHKQNAFSKKECEAILAIEEEYKPSEVQADNQTFHRSAIRTSSAKQIYYEEPHFWLFKKLNFYVQQVNKEYQFDISGLMGTQVIRYETGQYYNWHSDLGAGHISTRKLSIILLLSEPEDYEGGLVKWTPGFDNYPKTQGTLIVFPSYIPHKVKPVTKGTRYVLVTWAHGEKSFC